MTRYLIDPPTPFDDLATWEAFRRDMLELDQAAPEVKFALAQADEAIARLRGEPSEEIC